MSAMFEGAALSLYQLKAINHQCMGPSSGVRPNGHRWSEPIQSPPHQCMGPSSAVRSAVSSPITVPRDPPPIHCCAHPSLAIRGLGAHRGIAVPPAIQCYAMISTPVHDAILWAELLAKHIRSLASPRAIPMNFTAKIITMPNAVPAAF